MFLVASVLMCLIAVPMALRKVRRNPWYGFRTPATLRKPELWYAVNATAGRGMFLTGLISLAGTLILGAMIADVDLYALLMAALLVGGMMLTLVYTWRKHLA